MPRWASLRDFDELLPFADLCPLDDKLTYCLSHTLTFITFSISVRLCGLQVISYRPIMLSNLRRAPASFSHPLRQHFTPPVKRPFIMAAPDINFLLMTQNCVKVYQELDSRYKSLVKLKLTCDLKSKTVACGAKVKECHFPVMSTTKIIVTNLFDLNTILKSKPG